MSRLLQPERLWAGTTMNIEYSGKIGRPEGQEDWGGVDSSRALREHVLHRRGMSRWSLSTQRAPHRCGAKRRSGYAFSLKISTWSADGGPPRGGKWVLFVVIAPPRRIVDCCIRSGQVSRGWFPLVDTPVARLCPSPALSPNAQALLVSLFTSLVAPAPTRVAGYANKGNPCRLAEQECNAT